MNTLIKVSLFFSAILALHTKSMAQPGTEICKIHYSYDAAGNRIQREYKCEQPPNPNDPVDPAHPPDWLQPDGIISNIYPVPTTGIINLVFSAPVSNAQIIITNMSGVQVLTQNITQQVSSTVVDMTALTPGTYLLSCFYQNTVESYTIPKL